MDAFFFSKLRNTLVKVGRIGLRRCPLIHSCKPLAIMADLRQSHRGLDNSSAFWGQVWIGGVVSSKGLLRDSVLVCGIVRLQVRLRAESFSPVTRLRRRHREHDLGRVCGVNSQGNWLEYLVVCWQRIGIGILW